MFRKFTNSHIVVPAELAIASESRNPDVRAGLKPARTRFPKFRFRGNDEIGPATSLTNVCDRTLPRKGQGCDPHSES